MIELTAVLFILTLFIFPLPALVISLGLFTAWGLYRKYETYNNQPTEGKTILILTASLFLLNFIFSLFTGIALALGVYYLIYENFYLLIFNFIFCFAISLRWFDFTHHLYRLFIFKLKPFKNGDVPRPHFAVLQSFREKGRLGLNPVCMDAGTLESKKNKLVFRGVFCEKTFSPLNVIQAEKKSAEKIKILTHATNLQQPHIFIITLKEQFYPFKSRVIRDEIFQNLSFDLKAPVTS